MIRALLIKALLYLFAVVPLPVSHALGALIGSVLPHLPGRIRSVTRTNIDLCFPDRSLQERQRLVNACLRETGKTVLEIGALWLRPGRMVLRLIREVDGIGHVEAAQAKGQGIILATPHLGAWEVAGLYCAAHYDITCLYRPLRMTELDELVRKARNRAGGNYVPTTAQGIRTLYRTLGENRAVAMLPDQEPQSGAGIFAPFFGTPAYTMLFLSRLTIKTGAPIVFVWSERLSFGRGYRLHFRPALAAAYDDDLAVSVAAINRSVENLIRECPAQYQWNYRRFRTRPEGEPPLY
ncbi:MAG: lysophospholipid acyltransferase family protein [Halobacteria archaeon]|nr:lysophospholipid acyltransferase family protein [Halobacteria archaeon]